MITPLSSGLHRDKEKTHPSRRHAQALTIRPQTFVIKSSLYEQGCVVREELRWESTWTNSAEDKGFPRRRTGTDQCPARLHGETAITSLADRGYLADHHARATRVIGGATAPRLTRRGHETSPSKRRRASSRVNVSDDARWRRDCADRQSVKGSGRCGLRKIQAAGIAAAVAEKATDSSRRRRERLLVSALGNDPRRRAIPTSADSRASIAICVFLNSFFFDRQRLESDRVLALANPGTLIVTSGLSRKERLAVQCSNDVNESARLSSIVERMAIASYTVRRSCRTTIPPVFT